MGKPRVRVLHDLVSTLSDLLLAANYSDPPCSIRGQQESRYPSNHTGPQSQAHAGGASPGNLPRSVPATRLTSPRQAVEAGKRLRQLLKPDDTLHFYTSPYRRTRETTEGILQSLTADDPEPSPFPRDKIKVWEEPRLREQDFGNFQPSSAEMTRMWQERADYGHFFYRIPNGESAADAYDRVAGFNESLWRTFNEPDFASVCILVTHGLMTRVFLMKWYHWSVEYFEDLRNVNHCEFIVMGRSPDSGKYVLRNQLRTWSQYRRDLAEERRGSTGGGGGTGGPLMTPAVATAAAAAASAPLATPAPQDTSPVPVRKMWSSRQDSISRRSGFTGRHQPRRQNTEELFQSEDEDSSRGDFKILQLPSQGAGRKSSNALAKAAKDHPSEKAVGVVQVHTPPTASTDDKEGEAITGAALRKHLNRRPTLKNARLYSADTVMMLSAGRDGGGSRSGNCSSSSASESDDGPHFGPHYGMDGVLSNGEEEHDASSGHRRTKSANAKDNEEARLKHGTHTSIDGVLDEDTSGGKNGTARKVNDGAPKSMSLALSGALEDDKRTGAIADALGDQSQDEADLDKQVRRMKKRERSFESSVR